MLKKATVIAALAAGLLAYALAPRVAAAAQADFSDQTIQWIIPFKEGGGTDKWARFYAPLLAAELPGRPNVVVINISGGGSTTGANRFVRRAGDDGLMILGTSGSTQFPFLLGDRRVKYDYNDWHALIGSPNGGVVYVRSDIGARSAKDILKLRARQFIFGSQGPTSLDMIPLLAFEILGMHVKAVFGMKGRSAGRLAFLRGDVSIDYQTPAVYRKSIAPLVQKGDITPLFVFGVLDDEGNLRRDPALPHLPHFAEFYEMAHGKPPSGKAFKVWKTLLSAGMSAQKMAFVPKSAPPEITAAYREAFARIVRREGFAQNGKLLGGYPQVTGNAAEAMKMQATTIDADTRRWAQAWLANRYDVRF